MRPRLHTHVCAECWEKFPCDGELSANVDGWPEVVCALFHEDGQRQFKLCEDCLTSEITEEMAGR